VTDLLRGRRSAISRICGGRRESGAMARPRRAGLLVSLASLALLGGCTTDSADDDDDDLAGAYAHIIEWIAERSAQDSDRPVVFVVALGEGFDIDLGLQAAIVSDSTDDVDVQFLDDRSEAFDDDDVRDSGVLLAVGPANTEGGDIVIEANEERSVDDVTSWQFALSPVDDDWSFAEPPSTIAE
jgi:hypothetical protein